MDFRTRLRKAVDILAGVSTYEPPDSSDAPDLDDASVVNAREAVGGNLQPLPSTRLRWYLEDVESAMGAADAGNIRPAAQLCRAMRRDGTMSGLINARTKGLVQLPKRFYGSERVGSMLKARNGTRSVFDEMFPPAELELLDADGFKLGISVAELVPVRGRDYPVMVRLEPEFLQYRWAENRWYFTSHVGSIPITPGDGRWILHVPGGRLTPWTSGMWPALGRSFINKDHAMMYRSNYCATLANPARMAYAPSGATEAQRVGFFRKLLGWRTNPVFELPAGWDAKLLESNGRGWEVFQRQIDTADKEYMIAIAGQILTTEGGTGFDGQDIAEAIRQDLIQSDGDALAYTLNTQGIPQFILSQFGEEALNEACIVEWDTGSGVDKERESRLLGQSADAIARLTTSLAPHDLKPDVEELATRFSIPTKKGAVVQVQPPQETTGEAGAGDLKTEKPEAAGEKAPPKAKKPTDGDDADLEEDDEDAA